ncbi:hypothetical protein BH09BAC6_BH09BAC6_16040 [soil metagenome]|jgi:hypothetical protein
MKIYKAIIFFLVFTLLLAAPPFLLMQTGHGNMFIADFWTIFLFLSGLTLFVVTGILIVRQMFPTMFSEAFMGATVVKILGCLIFVVVFLANNKVNKYVFVGDFFYIYFLNTAFEVYILLRTLRNKNLR